MHRAKLLQLFSPHPMDKQVYSCCHNFLTVTQSYSSKNTPISKFYAVKIAKSVFLYVFTMTFPTSPLESTCDFCEALICPCVSRKTYEDNNVTVVLCVDFHVNGMIGCVAEAISTVITGVGVAVHVQFL